MFSLFRMDLRPLHWIGLWASLACLCLSQIVYRLILCAGKQSDSPAMIAHAKHVRLDSVSTIAVIVAILAAEVGFRQLDSIIAILEAVHVLFECSKMMHRAINRLMDASIDEEYLDRIQTIVSRDRHVRDVTDIKGKHSGRGISLDIEILLDERRKIADCNETVRALKKTIRREIGGVESVHIHYHPCRSEETASIPA
jgi:cation diffusion facilitator family transporter